MRRLLLLVMLLASPVASAQPGTDAGAAAESVVKQLEAFRRGDFDAAYTFAAAAIKERFDRREFERMVTDGYPEIARSTLASVARAELASNGNAYVHVRVQGANGNSVEALYEMVWEDDAWKVNAVVTWSGQPQRIM
ncbi:MAG: DUF4864 domain-containing protein [Candidatus Rokubacteria bacterium]|nr:DUF4864 domain-containing protein [Candidatus Rokubacteria bacterium]